MWSNYLKKSVFPLLNIKIASQNHSKLLLYIKIEVENGMLFAIKNINSTFPILNTKITLDVMSTLKWIHAPKPKRREI